MGIDFSSIFKRLFFKKDMRILMVGLDAAGKTTILYKMKLGEVLTTIPTIGFNVESLEFKKLNFTIWDIGGQDKIRPLWTHYYNGTHGIIFVIDSSDVERLDSEEYGAGKYRKGDRHTAKQELQYLLDQDELRDAALLVLANKQDLPGALTVSEIADRLERNKLRNRRWLIQGTSATSGEGLVEGFTWLSETLDKN